LHAECELTVHVLQIIHLQLAGSGLAQKKRKRKYSGPRLAQPFWADISPLFSGFMPGPVMWVGPSHMFLIIFIWVDPSHMFLIIYIYIYISFKKNEKKFQKISKILKKNYDFLKYFSTKFV
jgi:hypothetical protein